MAIVQLGTGATLEDYNKMQARLADAGVPVPGRILQVCYGDAENVRILNVWESREACDSFMDSVMLPLFQEFGLADRDIKIEFAQVHKIALA